ncbi:hypothetical protein [Herminiimonas sp. CN]|uniref:hypothetical protein n=1 Tax=Herminiimonas sp. CN TaxID=1349818 RepID=UPI0012DFD17E|nr:hypothetical protein [Herminiimonas sp. CN]
MHLRLREQLRDYFQQSGNQHTIIMHELIAVLMMSLSRNELISSKHDQHDYN